MRQKVTAFISILLSPSFQQPVNTNLCKGSNKFYSYDVYCSRLEIYVLVMIIYSVLDFTRKQMRKMFINYYKTATGTVSFKDIYNLVTFS